MVKHHLFWIVIGSLCSWSGWVMADPPAKEETPTSLETTPIEKSPFQTPLQEKASAERLHPLSNQPVPPAFLSILSFKNKDEYLMQFQDYREAKSMYYRGKMLMSVGGGIGGLMVLLGGVFGVFGHISQCDDGDCYILFKEERPVGIGLAASGAAILVTSLIAGGARWSEGERRMKKIEEQLLPKFVPKWNVSVGPSSAFAQAQWRF